MSVTYTDDRARPYGEPAPAAHQEEMFVPVYARGKTARKRSGQKGFKTWMILAPVGAVVLGGAAAAMLMSGSGEETVQPAALEPAATAPVLPAAPVTTPAAPAAVAATPAEAAPVVRETAPVRRAEPAPARRAAPRADAPAARTATPAPTPAPAPSVSPTETLNTTPATPTPPPPAIVVQPLG